MGERRTHIKQAVQILQHCPLRVFDDETPQAQAALGVFVELVHVAELVEDGAEVNRAPKDTGHGVPARAHRADKGLAFKFRLLRQLCELRACVWATKNLARELEDLPCSVQ